MLKTNVPKNIPIVFAIQKLKDKLISGPSSSLVTHRPTPNSMYPFKNRALSQSKNTEINIGHIDLDGASDLTSKFSDAIKSKMGVSENNFLGISNLPGKVLPANTPNPTACLSP